MLGLVRYPKVHFIRPELQRLLPQYRLIRDALAGENAVKFQGPLYLPYPGEEKCPEKKKARYEGYKTRANYYNVTRRTLSGLVGQVFQKDPVVKIPEALKPVVKDASGTGVPLNQQAKKTLELTLAYSRSGLFVDFPTTDGNVTRKQQEEEFIRPTIYTYTAEEIVNWRIIERGARDILSMVALYETYGFGDDGFELKSAEQYRVLRLDAEGYYYQEVWREREANETKVTDPYSLSRESGKIAGLEPAWMVHEVFYPTDANGNRFREIPFMFIGSENNDPSPDHPNFYDLASLNIAHYRNSADYEESLFVSGQPTIVVGGLTEKWIEEVLGGEVLIGSRGGIPLPQGGTAKLLQPTDKQPGLAALEHKEKQMIALGAKLVEQRKVERTAFETKLAATADGSVLSNTAKNVSEGFTWALGVCAKFVGSSEECEMTLNTEYDLVRMSPEDQQQVITTWAAGALSFKEMRDVLREAGLATEDDKVVLAEAEEKRQKDIEMQREQFAAKANAKEGVSDAKSGEGKKDDGSKKED